MLTLVIRRNDRVILQVDWEVGNRCLTAMRLGLDSEETIQVVATGPELEYIRERFTNVPMVSTRNRICWIGDVAAFIINHLTDS